jgi:ABC-2 type transport system permease protein
VSAAELRVLQRRGTAALAGREIRRVLGLWTQTILPPVVTALLFLAVFGGALGDRIDRVEGVRYLPFILPGLLVMTVAGQATGNSATSLFQAKQEGYLEDVLTSPLRSWQIVGAYVAGSLVRAFAATLAITVLAAPFAGGVDRVAVAIIALVLTGVIFASLGVISGVWAETFDQHSFVASIVITPLALVGGVFYSARSLGEPWSTLTRLDPIYYLVDATRAGFTGFHESSVWLSLLVGAIVTGLVFTAAVALVARGWRLKP